MKKLLLLVIAVACLAGTLSALAVTVDEDNQYVIVETELYKIHWQKSGNMGYIKAFVEGSDESIIGAAGRAFYHASKYADGWKDWSGLQEWEILEEAGGKAVVQYISKDAGNKVYTCVAHYHDSVTYIKHEVTVTADGADVTSFESDHEPQFEVNMDVVGMQVFTQPFPHAVYWTENGFFGALYGPDAESAGLQEWGGRNPGRLKLNHDNMGENLKDGESGTIVYYVAFGKGDEKDGNELANEVQGEPPLGGAVSPVGSLTTTWAGIKSAK